MNGDLCPAAIRPFRPVNDTEVPCGLEADHDGKHKGVLRDYAYPGSATTLAWLDDDRRCFYGEWPGSCDRTERCLMPSGHPRKCAPE